MPFVHILSNVSKTAVDEDAATAALSKTMTAALEKPEQYVMVILDLEKRMRFGTSTAGRVYLALFPQLSYSIRSIGQIDSERNPKTVDMVTAAVAEALNLPGDRVYVNLDDVAGGNWGMSGKTF